eukprot:1884502-Pleurochrysis_carterae.AAC.3
MISNFLSHPFTATAAKLPTQQDALAATSLQLASIALSPSFNSISQGGTLAPDNLRRSQRQGLETHCDQGEARNNSVSLAA